METGLWNRLHLAHMLVALVLLSYSASFVSLRVNHFHQIESTKAARFVYFPTDLEAKDLARRLERETPVKTYPIDSESTEIAFKGFNIRKTITASSLLLPNGNGYAIAQGRAADEILKALFGGPTPYFLGSVTAAAALAIWVAFAVWWRKLSYLGALWPAVGILAVSLASKSCQECRFADELSWLPWLGILGFLISLAVFVSGNHPARWLLSIALLASTASALLQALALVVEPRLCPFCITSSLASAGTFWASWRLLSERSPRCVLLPKSLAGAVATTALAAATFQSFSTSARAATTKDYHSVIGRSLYSYVKGAPKLTSTCIILVSLPTCGACGKARTDLVTSKVPFVEISYQTLTETRSAFKADFNRVAPLVLVCDAAGKIHRAEAGWPSSPNESNELVNSYKQLIGGEYVSKT